MHAYFAHFCFCFKSVKPGFTINHVIVYSTLDPHCWGHKFQITWLQVIKTLFIILVLLKSEIVTLDYKMIPKLDLNNRFHFWYKITEHCRNSSSEESACNSVNHVKVIPARNSEVINTQCRRLWISIMAHCFQSVRNQRVCFRQRIW